jgi:hypothetical protein
MGELLALTGAGLLAATAMAVIVSRPPGLDLDQGGSSDVASYADAARSASASWM